LLNCNPSHVGSTATSLRSIDRRFLAYAINKKSLAIFHFGRRGGHVAGDIKPLICAAQQKKTREQRGKN
jgi:hypothetical protein